MARTIIDIHILQTVPPSNLNRDDTGTPKSATYGGVRRARVSSQAWKRATREAFEELLPASELGVRTRKVAEALAERIADRAATLNREAAVALATETLQTATGLTLAVPKRKAKKEDAEPEEEQAPPESSYLVFLSRRQLDALAELALEGAPDGDLDALKRFLKTRENKARARQAVNTRHSVDIALFGRMVADSADLNVDAATQVAHALSVHGAEVESDYYTAIDDLNKKRGEKEEGDKRESGAGMIGTIDFNSATLYRYAAVDVDALHRNLGGELSGDDGPPAARAAAAFVEAFVTSLPSGKINSFGHQTLPAAVLVKVRGRRPISFVGAFEQPVPATPDGGYLKESCVRLADHIRSVEGAYGLPRDEPAWLLRVGAETQALAELTDVTEVGLADLVAEVSNHVAGRLGANA
ncbi:type I-E CRISPR-associated protein Cas7/Cse4/CasC [Streptomyces sp. 3MP-14]|uniref:Type I-E CRISPR-associated protein Cas7/Cse4/CasC n=1 Tax=Streptomyces mimosae TaxID=2586635 RepID=A0A5N6AMI4_9ACTN|nr:MULTISPECIES: type I-E CRISPR-associated protein Cas7/Cse4/CasC [Streptomyces]KAB8169844.1 type I-E CRISPR-associated protein Cas7/Cse4/CasC [Streptomyces mimosae]KAB8178592.1 type I-E CRISPR-associated protein Cas7/Cse4/CasC [Streptomyces sp. 3MP-14]